MQVKIQIYCDICAKKKSHANHLHSSFRMMIPIVPIYAFAFFLPVRI